MMRQFGLIVLALAGAAAPALAADETGYQAIAAGNLAAAERGILAAVYRRTGREADARALYQRVLQRREVAMDMPSGAVVSSHELARRGLGTGAVQIATR